MAGSSIYYKGNRHVRAAGVVQSLTQHQLDEYEKCKNDVEYFIENYVRINTTNADEFEKFILRPYQKRIIDVVKNNRKTICLFPRQAGKSTTVGGYLLHTMLFRDNKSILVAAHIHVGAKDFMDRIKVMYESLPFWLQLGVTSYNDFSMSFENGSKIRAVATTKNSGRGGTFDIAVLDEFAHVDKGVADSFYASIRPTIDSGKESKLIIISTPLGLNHFHTLWKATELGKTEFKPVSAKWNEVPGRDEKFRQSVIAEFGETRWNQEYECRFLGSTNTLISSHTLENLVSEEPIKKLDHLKIYKAPMKDHHYFMSVDTSRGKGLDYSAFVVVDITQYPYEVVAVYRDDSIVAMHYPNQIFAAAKLYNKCPILVETNDVGAQVADILQYDLEYENVLGTTAQGRAGQVLSAGGNKLGIYMTGPTKRVGCSALKAIMENNKLLVCDETIINELKIFTLQNDSYKAADDGHDDTVMCLVSFAWATQQPYFKDLTDQDIRKNLFDGDLQKIQEELVPFGYILDSADDRPVYEKLDDSDDMWERIDNDDWNPLRRYKY